MENRRRLMMVANVLLYFGPLLAGLGGYGWAQVPIFTAIFVLWLMILQPMEFPINKREWLSKDAWVAVTARAVTQLLFVVILFGVGRGIGGVLGAITLYSHMLPLAISFVSIPLARTIWDPWAQPPAPPSHPTLNSDVRQPLDSNAPTPADMQLGPDPSKLSPP